MQVAPAVLADGRAIRQSKIDWLSLSADSETDDAMRARVEATRSVIRDACGYGEVEEMKSAGNFGEGLKFTRFGAEIKWTTRTQATINDWDEQGRCVGKTSLVLRGSSGIGSLPLDKAVSLITSLIDLGFVHCKRIDTTVDLFDDPYLDVFVIKEMLERGEWRIPRRDPKSYVWHGSVIRREGEPTPSTLYLAPKSSDNRVTIYDKGAQMESHRPWIRFERKSTKENAQAVFEALLERAEAVWEGGMALPALDKFVRETLKASADIRDVSQFPEFPNLPKNWMRSPNAKTPECLEPVLGEVAALDLTDFRISGGLAAQFRHAIRSTGKCVWKMCLIHLALGKDPGRVAIELGFPHHGRITDEDFVEMAQASGVTIEALEQAELSAQQLFIEMTGADVHVVGSDRTELRREALARLTNQP